MKRSFAIAALVVSLVVLLPQANAATFSHQVNLYGDWQEYLDSATNAEVYTERFAGRSTYWRPTVLGAEGVVVYHFPLTFAATSGTFGAGIAAFTSGWDGPNFDSSAYAYLDVSADGDNWTNVDGVYPGNGGYSGYGPHDISGIIAGSSDVWVRSRLFCTGTWGDDGPIFAQFMRTNPGQTTRTLFLDVEGNDVPEPTSLILWSGLGVMGLLAVRRKQKTAS